MSKLFGWFNKNKQADKAKPEDKKTSDNDVTSESVTPEQPQTQDAEPEAQETESSEQVTETRDAQQKSVEAEEIPATPDAEAEVEVDAITDVDTGPLSPTEEASAPATEPDEQEPDVAEPDVSDQFAPKAPAESDGAAATAEPKEKKKSSLFSRLKAGLSRTRSNLGGGFVSLFKGKTIDDELYEDLETQLLVADVGMDTTQNIIKSLTDSASRRDLKDAEALVEILKSQMHSMLQNVEMPLTTAMEKHDPANGPFVILMVGVNGVGKTTTIGKLAKQFQQQGQKVMLAAGDTFRAAAVEQLQVWGERNAIPVIAQPTGSDSASVLYDALEAAKARKMDVLIADTAGRLQNKNNLMEELKKVVRVMKKINPEAPHEVMLTLDAGTGQNAVSQARLFNEAVGLSGITLTKLDGTAKGGVIFSIADQFGIPIRYIGVGESIDDLRTFDSQEFIDALFSDVEQPPVKQ